MSGEPDLAAAIAEVQVALERLRLATDRSAASAQGWEFVDNSAEGSSEPRSFGVPRARVVHPGLGPPVLIHLPEPARYGTYSAFRRAVGALEHTDTLCHSFPSLAEARVYCYAAGVPLPHLRQ